MPDPCRDASAPGLCRLFSPRHEVAEGGWRAEKRKAIMVRVRRRAGASRRAIAAFVRVTGPRFRLRSTAKQRSCLRSSASSWQGTIVSPGGAPVPAREPVLRDRRAGAAPTAPGIAQCPPQSLRDASCEPTKIARHEVSTKCVRPASRRLAKRPFSGRGGSMIEAVWRAGISFVPGTATAGFADLSTQGFTKGAPQAAGSRTKTATDMVLHTKRALVTKVPSLPVSLRSEGSKRGSAAPGGGRPIGMSGVRSVHVCPPCGAAV